jgi:hypothetical protein
VGKMNILRLLYSLVVLGRNYPLLENLRRISLGQSILIRFWVDKSANRGTNQQENLVM